VKTSIFENNLVGWERFEPYRSVEISPANPLFLCLKVKKMSKPIEEQCKICQLFTEDRLRIEERLKED
jgi:hypothetical protein